MKKCFMSLIVLGGMLLLSGCVQKLNISDAQTNIVAEYVAATLVDYQEVKRIAHNSDIIDTIITVAPTPTPEVEKENDSKDNENKDTDLDNEPDVTETPKSNSSIEEILGLSKFTVTYSGYGLYDTYPDDESMVYFQIIPPRSTNQLLVVSFLAENNSKKTQKIDLKDVKVSYQLDIDTGSIYKPLLTFMPNDMQYISVEVEGKKSLELILVFEVSKDINMDKINLLMSRDDQARIIKLK